MKKKTKILQLSPENLQPAPPMEEIIRKRAYEIWLERGGGHGREHEDWLQAEAEVQSINQTWSLQ